MCNTQSQVFLFVGNTDTFLHEGVTRKKVTKGKVQIRKSSSAFLIIPNDDRKVFSDFETSIYNIDVQES